MSNHNEHADGEPGREAPSTALDMRGLPIEFVRELARIAVGGDGSMEPEAAIQVDLRKTQPRSKILETLVHEICPQNVNPVLWTRWLNGGTPPFLGKPEKPPLKKPTRDTERPANLPRRTTERVADQEKVVAQARARLEQEETHLAQLRAHDNAALHFVVVNQLVEIMTPIFAMGPAWTIMRALSPYASDEAAEFATSRMDEGPSREKAKADYADLRREEHEAIMEALDFFSGDLHFENDVRTAVKDAIRFHEKRRPELLAAGRRPRGKERRQAAMHPAAKPGANELIASFGETDRSPE